VSAHMVLMRVLEGPPKPLIEFAPHTPAELVAICEKAMERDPKRRYRDMVELAEDLRAYLERRVVKAYESGTWAETKKWVQRNKPLAASLASAVVVLVAGVITSLLYAEEANAARKDLSEKNTALAEATQLAEKRAEAESRLKNEALKREREGKVRGLIQELEYFDSLDDDVYTYARKQTRPAYEWWIEGARKLVDGVEEDLAHNIPWSPGLKDVEAELAKVRERALPRTPEEIEADRRAHPKFAEYEQKRLELQWMSRMLGKEPWPPEEEVEAQLAKEELPKTASTLVDLASELVNRDEPAYGCELRAMLLARRALAAAEKELLDTATKRAEWERKQADAPSNAGSAEPTHTNAEAGFTNSKDRSYSAGQATGAPDANPESDDQLAWAYANPGSGSQWLEVRFDPPARATHLRIHEVHAAGGVAMVLATDAERGLHTLFVGQDPTQHPGVFELPVGVEVGAIASLRIVMDANRSSTWQEIDSVELVTTKGPVWASSARASSEYGAESDPDEEDRPVSDADVAVAQGRRDRALGALASAQVRAGRLEDARESLKRFFASSLREPCGWEAIRYVPVEAKPPAHSKWKARVFAWTNDPSRDPGGWLAESERGTAFEVTSFHSPDDAQGSVSTWHDVSESIAQSEQPQDRFGVVAELREVFPAGTWLLATTSDDGLRVWVDDRLAIDVWWREHASLNRIACWSSDGTTATTLRLHYYEFLGGAVLRTRITRVEPAPEHALRSWTDAKDLTQREIEHAEKEQTLAALRAETEARATWRFSASDDTWWHKQLVGLSTNLRRVQKRLDFAVASVVEAESARAWDAAVEAIAKSEQYRESKWPSGKRLTRQLGLVPIGPDPTTGLWEFAHLATGRPAWRAADGKIALEPETGLVMVLLPGGRVPRADSADQHQDETLTRVDLDPFFLSKYEMTRGQWDRIGGWTPPGREAGDPLLPAADLSWEDCQSALSRPGWLRLSTGAQWEYACRARTRSMWWTGNDPSQLIGVANIDFTKDDRAQGGAHRCGSLRANPFGLHDVHGNVQEWCQDPWIGGERRAGDGLYEGITAAGPALASGPNWDDPSAAASSSRDGFPPGYRNDDFGLRPSRGITP